MCVPPSGSQAALINNHKDGRWMNEDSNAHLSTGAHAAKPSNSLDAATFWACRGFALSLAPQPTQKKMIEECCRQLLSVLDGGDGEF